mgnify:CR=1 FL=1
MFFAWDDLYCNLTRENAMSGSPQAARLCYDLNIFPLLRSIYSHSFSGYWPSAVLRAMASTTKGLSSR